MAHLLKNMLITQCRLWLEVCCMVILAFCADIFILRQFH